MAFPRRFIILLGFILSATAWAADKVETAQLTALWLDGRRPAGELFIADAKGQPQKLSVGVATRGAPFALPSAGKPIVLLRKSTAPAPDTKAPSATAAPANYEPAGEISWPSGGARKILLLLAAANPVGAPLTVRGVAIADDLTGFPLGTLRFANFLGSDLVGRVGAEVKTLPAGPSAASPYPVKPAPGSKAVSNFPVGIARQDSEGKADLLFNSRLDAWPHSRSLLLIFPGKTAEAGPVIRTVVETIPPSPAPNGLKPKSS